MNKVLKYGLPFAVTAVIMALILIWKAYYVKKHTREMTITFQIDMRKELMRGRPISTIALRGSEAPLDWHKDYPLADTNEDGLYETTLVVKNPQELEYKFVISGETVEWEDGGNRRLPLPSNQNNLLLDHTWNQKDN